MINYKNKYLKYKKKYLTLGGSNINKSIKSNKTKNIIETKKSFIGSWNISWAIQENIVAGSEEDYVRKCKIKYGEDKIDTCYKNTLDILKNFNRKNNIDLLGLQEVSDPDIYNKINKRIKNLDQHIRHLLWNSKLKKYISVLTCWNSKIFGLINNEIVFNLSLDYNDYRPCSVILTTKKFLIINVHFPQFKTKKDLENITYRMSHNIPEKFFKNSIHHILLGDTNDGNTLINKNSPLTLKYSRNVYKFHNNITKQNLKKNYGTCCWHEKGHKFRDPKIGKQIFRTGDYILSTTPTILKNQKVYNTTADLSKYTRQKLNYTSDHYFAYSELNL